jgi:hypothetical protein
MRAITFISTVSETVRNGTHVHFLLRMADIMTSQNIGPSSWDILYIISDTYIDVWRF